jgi:hypothetical protein
MQLRLHTTLAQQRARSQHTERIDWLGFEPLAPLDVGVG